MQQQQQQQQQQQAAGVQGSHVEMGLTGVAYSRAPGTAFAAGVMPTSMESTSYAIGGRLARTTLLPCKGRGQL